MTIRRNITRRKLLKGTVAAAAAANAITALGALAAAPQAKAAETVAGDALKGKIYTKSDASYETFRKAATWNARKPNRYPNAIVHAESIDDVVAAVKLAKANNWQVATRSGGHSFTGSHTRDNAVLINIYKMKELKVDVQKRTAIVSPAWFGDHLNDELAKDNLVALTAHDPNVGIGGFTLCGGHSTLGRMYGPACASLSALDLINADGELIHADEKQNSDYLWAARGSGPGFFGVAVRFYLNLYPLPTHRMSSGFIFDPGDLDEVALWLGAHQNAFPRVLESVLTGSTTKEGKSIIRMGGTVHGSSEKEADEALKLIENSPVVAKATSKRLRTPYTGKGGGGIIPGSRQILDGLWITATPDKILAQGRDSFVKLPTQQSFMLWLHWGPPHKLPDMCYSLQGDIYMSPNAIYYDAADDARCAAWSADLISKLRPLANGSQMNDENMQFNKGAYLSKESAAKLEVLRKKYDPQRRFAGFLT
jgi:FAD/FMN-containing dehydrogenase